MPASLRSCAGTISVRARTWGRNFPDFLLTPPPMMMRSGQKQLLHELHVVAAGGGPTPSTTGRRPPGRTPRPSPRPSPWCSGQVAELGVRHQRAVDEQGAADAGAERDEEHDAVIVPARHRSASRRCRPRRRRSPHRPARPVACLNSAAASVPIQLWSMLDAVCDDAVEDDRRERQADRAGRVELRHDLLHHRRDGVGRRRLRRRDADALGREARRRRGRQARP